MADDSHEMIYKNISSKNDDVLMLNQNMLKLKSIGWKLHDSYDMVEDGNKLSSQ